VEDTAALVRVVDYIHLNPVRAGVVEVAQLSIFRWSSLRRFVSVSRPKWLRADWLDQHGLKDEVSGWKRYAEHLVELSGSAAEQERRQFGQMTRGWAIGTTGWRKAIAKDHAQMALASGVSDEALREIREARFAEILIQVLGEADKDDDANKNDAKSARWKIVAAQRLRERANAPHAWIAENLNMGSPTSVRAYLCRNR
jgi:putative transposase